VVNRPHGPSAQLREVLRRVAQYDDRGDGVVVGIERWCAGHSRYGSPPSS